ncbi:hypothetical protein PBY51_016631 [Eleginops maclovinus]|uniref:Secreted protein n=1 Tax=Eleginops maclovinus TaxID=56733 RepID=A0AAN7WRK3_ELEMC|nr:hypothetical protein PBY51_016631 [Eleginops maclovinus]
MGGNSGFILLMLLQSSRVPSPCRGVTVAVTSLGVILGFPTQSVAQHADPLSHRGACWESIGGRLLLQVSFLSANESFECSFREEEK